MGRCLVSTPERAPGSDPGLGELVGDFTQDVSTLIRDEMALAKVEIQQSVKDAGVGAGLFSAAGIVAMYGLGALIATGILALALLVDAWLAALIVTGVLFLIAGALAFVGKRHLAEVSPAVDSASDNVRRDIETVKGGTR